MALIATWGSLTAQPSIWKKSEIFLTEGITVSIVPLAHFAKTSLTVRVPDQMARRMGIFDMRIQAQRRLTVAEMQNTT